MLELDVLICAGLISFAAEGSRRSRKSTPDKTPECHPYYRDEKNDQIAHRGIVVAGRGTLRNYGRNNNSPETGWDFHPLAAEHARRPKSKPGNWHAAWLSFKVDRLLALVRAFYCPCSLFLDSRAGLRVPCFRGTLTHVHPCRATAPDACRARCWYAGCRSEAVHAPDSLVRSDGHCGSHFSRPHLFQDDRHDAPPVRARLADCPSLLELLPHRAL